jgi:hypothetical protein
MYQVTTTYLPTYKSYIHIFLNANIFKHLMHIAIGLWSDFFTYCFILLLMDEEWDSQ